MECPSTCTRRNISYLTCTRSRGSKKGWPPKSGIGDRGWVRVQGTAGPQRASLLVGGMNRQGRPPWSRERRDDYVLQERLAESSAGMYVALCFVILHDTPGLHLMGSVRKRQNGLYISGKISLTLLALASAPMTRLVIGRPPA